MGKARPENNENGEKEDMNRKIMHIMHINRNEILENCHKYIKELTSNDIKLLQNFTGGVFYDCPKRKEYVKQEPKRIYCGEGRTE